MRRLRIHRRPTGPNRAVGAGAGAGTGAADGDPSGIATCSQAGAPFVPGLLWTVVITFPFMAAL